MGKVFSKLCSAHEKAYKNYKKSKRRFVCNKKFPFCIGMFPECKEYTKEMKKEQRPECRTCPYK